MQIDFFRSAVYAFVILANFIPYVTTLTNLSFSIDGEEVGSFMHFPSSSTDYEYHVPAYVNTSLLNMQHTLTMQTAIGDNASLVLFDYVIYSVEIETIVSTSSAGLSAVSPKFVPPSTSPITVQTSSKGHKNTGLIVGTVLGGLVAVLINVTVDDQNGDSMTGGLPLYSGSSKDNWQQGATCKGCAAQPNASFAFDSTWHDATWNPGDPAEKLIEINFVGSAVYAFVILANTIPFTTTLTNLRFSIDGDEVGNFVHIPSASSDYEYNVPANVNTSLVNTKHTLSMQTTGDNASLVLFDYLIYSADNEIAVTTTSSFPPSSFSPNPTSFLPVPSSATSSSSKGHKNTGFIVGTVLGGIIFTALLAGLFLCKRRMKGNVKVIYQLGGKPYTTDRLSVDWRGSVSILGMSLSATTYPTDPAYSDDDPVEQTEEFSLVLTAEIGVLNRVGKVQVEGSSVLSDIDVERRRRCLSLVEEERSDENDALRDQVLFLLDERLQAQQGRLGADNEPPPDYSTEGRGSPSLQPGL
ncbi:hypothetical protein EW145_g6028 [Phellinidium pouzarii]|uniref:Uncharacterized protein n=1 Tax=Phellinidium pouzarii TaxID=167371 RepID=A0A4S4KY65_9AGAM|nr:hypothetical protein EW145_g6028 [Phellinidium pouzarii]